MKEKRMKIVLCIFQERDIVIIYTKDMEINNNMLGSYNDERDFDISLRMQRRLIVSGYSAEDSQRNARVRSRYLSLSDAFINNAF